MKKLIISEDKFLQLLITYRQESIDTLKAIKPKWAVAKYIGKLYDQDLHPQENSYTMFWVDPKQLIFNAEFGEVNPEELFTGETKNDFRIVRLLYRWENRYFVDPPSIGLYPDPDKKYLCFSDGRHRTKLSYHLALKKIPLAVVNGHIRSVSKIIQLDPI